MFLQCVFNVFTMCFRCFYNVFTMFLQCVFYVFSMLFRCFYYYTRPKLSCKLNSLLTHVICIMNNDCDSIKYHKNCGISFNVLCMKYIICETFFVFLLSIKNLLWSFEPSGEWLIKLIFNDNFLKYQT